MPLGINVKKYIEDNCFTSYYSPFKIYRGIDYASRGNLLIGDSRTEERISAGTQNYYTQIMDNILPEWKPFPKRSRSFICSTNAGKANQFGNLYRVYPIGDPLVGICGAQDIWDSFNRFVPEELEDWFDNIASMVGIRAKDDLQTILEIIKLLDEDWDNIKNNHSERLLCNKYHGKFIHISKKQLVKFKSFSLFLSWIFSTNGFKLKKLSQIKTIPNDVEIWFSGPALFVDEDYNAKIS
jgi:hypothetical protein